MHWLKQSISITASIGPVLDSAGAEYTGLVIGDLTITKNGTSAAMAAAATVTHTSNGHYDLVFTTGNTDTLGRCSIRVNKATYQMPPHTFMVLPATVFDALVTNAVNSTGGLVGATAAITTAAGNLTPPTTAQIRTELATELARIDATISSRNATTPPTAAAVAAAVEAAILDEGDATALLAAIAAKVETFLINEGDATATMAAIAAAVRTNLATELARIDATISSRNATTPPTTTAIAQEIWDEINGADTNAEAAVAVIAAAVRTNLATELARIDATISSRNATTPPDATAIQTAASAALAAIFLDKIFAAAYNPASKPGNATGLFNVLVENDGGVPRYTANALEQAPAGGGGGGSLTPEQEGWLQEIYNRAVAGTLPASPLPTVPGDAIEIIPGDAYTTSSLHGEIVFTMPDSAVEDDAGRLLIYWEGGNIPLTSTVVDESGTKRLRFSMTEAESIQIPGVQDCRYQVGTIEDDENWTPIDGPVVVPWRHVT